jgi:hypothetical protein
MKVKYADEDCRYDLLVSFSGKDCKKNKVCPYTVFGVIKRVLKKQKSITTNISEYRTRWSFKIWDVNERTKNSIIKKLEKYNGKYKSYLREVEVS